MTSTTGGGMGARIRNFLGGNGSGNGNAGGGGNGADGRPANGRRASDDPTYVPQKTEGEEDFNIWDVKKPGNGDGGNGNGNTGGGNNSGSNNGGGDNGGGNGDTPFDLNKFIDDKGFGSQFQIPKEIADKLASGDMSVLPEILSQGLNSLGKEVYRHALMDSRQIINDKVEDAVKTAVTRANGERQSDEVIRMMQTDMPFTKDPNIAPVANAALSAAIKAGDKPEDAVKKVRKFFKHITGVTVGDDDIGALVNANGGASGGRGGHQGNQDVDWFAALSAGPSGNRSR